MTATKDDDTDPINDQRRHDALKKCFHSACDQAIALGYKDVLFLLELSAVFIMFASVTSGESLPSVSQHMAVLLRRMEIVLKDRPIA